MRAKRREPQPAPDRLARVESLLFAATVALLVATPLIPSESAVAFGTAAPLCLLWVLLLVGWSLLNLVRPDPQVRFGWTGVAAAALIGWHTLSALTAGMQGNARQALNVLWLWIGYGLAAFLLRQLLKTPAQCRAVVVVMIALAAAEAAHAGYEYFVAKPAQIAAFERNPEPAYQAAGATTETQRQQLRWRIEAVEPLGTFALTNSLAGFIAPWLIAVLGIGLTLFNRPDLRRSLYAAIGFGLLLAGCLLLTKSRTAVLATGGGVVLLAIYGRGTGSRLATWISWISWKLLGGIAAVGVVLALIAVAVGGLDVQVLSEAPLSVRYRLEYWRATAAMIVEQPLFGSGPGQFQAAYARYKLPQASETVADPHSFLLEVWATAGTPALVALLAMAVAFVWQLSRAEQVGTPSADRSLQRSWIYGGTLAGLVLAYPLGSAVGYPMPLLGNDLPLPVMWIIGLPIAALAVWLLDDWVQRGEMPTAVPIIALVVLLVNLLAAGATSFPGVFVSAWVLLPVALSNARAPAWNGPLSKSAVFGIVGVAFVLLAACVRTEASPVLSATTRLAIADGLMEVGRLDEADTELLSAAQADRFSPEPWRRLADLRMQKFVTTGRPEDEPGFSEAMLEFRRRDSRHSSTYEACGNWLLLSSRKKTQLGDNSGAIHAQIGALHEYQDATKWYPSRALGHAQLACILQESGRPKDAAAAAAEALRLDGLNPHEEQKLKNQFLYDPQITPAGVTPHRGENAEQAMLRLRSSTGLEKSP